MTGYHAWVFSFMFLVFHLCVLLTGRYGWKQEARTLGSLSVFWIVEDFLWFVMNPAYGLRKFRADQIQWHKKWLMGIPTDYIIFMIVGVLLIYWSFS